MRAAGPELRAEHENEEAQARSQAKGACVRVDARADSKDPARGRRARVLT